VEYTQTDGRKSRVKSMGYAPCEPFPVYQALPRWIVREAGNSSGLELGCGCGAVLYKAKWESGTFVCGALWNSVLGMWPRGLWLRR
jgi:hypothetical protein